MTRKLISTAVAALAVIALLIPAGIANADMERERERERHGSCDPRGRWELQLEKDGAHIEVDAEVTSGPAGQRWTVKLHHDGTKIADVEKRTRTDDDERPDLEVERRVHDRQGLDRFRVVARNTATGAHCAGVLSI